MGPTQIDVWASDLTGNNAHSVFNLTRPDKSLMLLAPLAQEAGAYGLCTGGLTDEQSDAVFASTQDPDYQRILALCQKGKAHLEQADQILQCATNGAELHLTPLVLDLLSQDEIHREIPG